MNLKNANTNSVLIARGGRVEAVLDVEMTIIVDTDGANYP